MPVGHNRDYRRARRLLEAICAESASAEATFATIHQLLDDRLLAAVRLLADASAEYARAVAVLRRVSRAPDVSAARSAARRYLVEIGRRP